MALLYQVLLIRWCEALVAPAINREKHQRSHSIPQINSLRLIRCETILEIQTDAGYF